MSRICFCSTQHRGPYMTSIVTCSSFTSFYLLRFPCPDQFLFLEIPVFQKKNSFTINIHEFCFCFFNVISWKGPSLYIVSLMTKFVLNSNLFYRVMELITYQYVMIIIHFWNILLLLSLTVRFLAQYFHLLWNEKFVFRKILRYFVNWRTFFIHSGAACVS